MTRICRTRQIFGHLALFSTSYSMEPLRLKANRHWRLSRKSESTQRSLILNLILTHMPKTWLSDCWRRSRKSASGQPTLKSSKIIHSSEISTGRHSEKPNHLTLHQGRGTEPNSLQQLTRSDPRHRPVSSKTAARPPCWVQAWAQVRVQWKRVRRVR